MENKTVDIMHDIFHETKCGEFVTVDELETITGERGHSIRKHVEILKEHGLVFEHEEGFTVSEKGKDFSRSRWA